MPIKAITNEQLVANGFKPVEYKKQEGVFYAKTLKAADMPYFSEHVVDDMYVFDCDTIVVEVCPDGRVQLVDQDTHYVEEAVPVDSEEGRALLADAGFIFN